MNIVLIGYRASGKTFIGRRLAKRLGWPYFDVDRGINEKEPEIFAEPALFLIQPDGHLFYAAYNSMPFGRPRPQDILDMVKFVEAEDYPARGEMRDFLLTKIH